MPCTMGSAVSNPLCDVIENQWYIHAAPFAKLVLVNRTQVTWPEEKMWFKNTKRTKKRPKIFHFKEKIQNTAEALLPPRAQSGQLRFNYVDWQCLAHLLYQNIHQLTCRVGVVYHNLIPLNTYLQRLNKISLWRLIKIRQSLPFLWLNRLQNILMTTGKYRVFFYWSRP